MAEIRCSKTSRKVCDCYQRGRMPGEPAQEEVEGRRIANWSRPSLNPLAIAILVLILQLALLFGACRREAPRQGGVELTALEGLEPVKLQSVRTVDRYGRSDQLRVDATYSFQASFHKVVATLENEIETIEAISADNLTRLEDLWHFQGASVTIEVHRDRQTPAPPEATALSSQPGWVTIELQRFLRPEEEERVLRMVRGVRAD